MDYRTMPISYDQVCNPYISVGDRKSGVFLDDFVCHKSEELKDKMKTDDSIVYMITTHYTDLLQPCDVGINKSLKDLLN